MNLNTIKHRIIYGHFDENNFNINHDDKLTMVELENLDTVKICLEECIKDNIKGDFIETGVWRGGTSIWAHNILKELDNTRKVYVYDSFEGCPIPNGALYPVDANDNHYQINHLAVSLERVQENFRLFGEINENTVFVKGWFKDTMPINKIDKLCIMRLDGDLYESTIQVLEALYSKLSSGGFCIIDDFGPHWGAYQATHDFREKYNITEPIINIPNTSSAYWKKF